MAEQRSEKYEMARNSLPEDLQPAFDDLVADFHHVAIKRQASPFVSHFVLADLVRMGWNLVEEPDSPRKQSRVSEQRFREVIHINPAMDEAFYDMDSWYSVASSYKLAGDILCEVVSNSGHQQSNLLFPIFFCYRHFLELSLKGLIQLNGNLSTAQPNKAPKSHVLDDLAKILEQDLSNDTKSTTMWTDVKLENGIMVAGTQTGSVKADLLQLTTWCQRFAGADPTSDRFRYPESNKGASYDFPKLKDLLGLDSTEQLKNEMTELSDAIQNIGGAIASELDDQCQPY